MFLVFYSPPKHIIEYVLQFIEDNSVLVGVITSVITSSLWLKKFLKQKRAEAFFGFYAQLSLCLKSLHTRLAEDGQLDVSCSESGNIFSLIYLENFVTTVCPRYTVPTKSELAIYKASAKELREILLKTENNVYPHSAKRDKWYDSQHVLFDFCDFIENEALWHKINKNEKINSESKHVIKCKAFIDAINYILESIEKAKY